jgi:hypothetical protein
MTGRLMASNYRAPEYRADAYTCPWCSVLAQQHWITLGRELAVTQCLSCVNDSVWYRKEMLVPTGASAPMPHVDLPEILRDDYMEARDIADRSPRSAAALLRLVIEQLCFHVGGNKTDLNACIGDLVKSGLDRRVQKMLDIVRVIGGQAVHPLEMDLRDDRETVQTLFMLVNEITDEMIAKENLIAAEYAKLPQAKRDAIEKRDAQSG